MASNSSWLHHENRQIVSNLISWRKTHAVLVPWNSIMIHATYAKARRLQRAECQCRVHSVSFLELCIYPITKQRWVTFAFINQAVMSSVASSFLWSVEIPDKCIHHVILFTRTEIWRNVLYLPKWYMIISATDVMGPQQ